MLYSIIGTDAPRSTANRAQTRPRHMAYIRPLMDQGRLILAGPTPAIDSPEPGPAGMTGSLIVAEFESLDAAKAWAAEDPYVLEGVFEHVRVQPFLKVFP